MIATASPYELARAVYEREPCVRTFEEDLRLHLEHGYVFSRPDFFIMGRHVRSTAPDYMVVNPAHYFPPDECDCWMVYLFAGQMQKAFAVLPWELPLVGFERKNELRFYKLTDIARLSQPDA